MTGLIKNSKDRYHRQLLNNNADSPDKFWSQIKTLYPTKSPSKSGSAFFVNGQQEREQQIKSVLLTPSAVISRMWPDY